MSNITSTDNALAASSTNLSRCIEKAMEYISANTQTKFLFPQKHYTFDKRDWDNDHYSLYYHLYNLHRNYNETLSGSTPKDVCKCLCSECGKYKKNYQDELTGKLLSNFEMDIDVITSKGFHVKSTSPIILKYDCGCEACADPDNQELQYVKQYISKVNCRGDRCRIQYQDGYGIHCVACYGEPNEDGTDEDYNSSEHLYTIQQKDIFDQQEVRFKCSGDRCRIEGCESCYGYSE